MRKKQRIFSFIQLFVAVALLTGFDQLTKLLAVKNLKGKADIPLIPDVLYFQYLENRGAAFGIFPFPLSRTSLAEASPESFSFNFL